MRMGGSGDQRLFSERQVLASGGQVPGWKKTALIAVAHTLLRLIHHALQTEKPFEERHAPALAEQRKQK
jgi:hypothetical protein